LSQVGRLFQPMAVWTTQSPESALLMVLDHSVMPAVILIVEDEMMLRMRAVDMVEDAGYTPLEAIDAD
jgi:hypothetical protein